MTFRWTVLLGLMTLTGCGPIDPEPPTDEDGNEIVVPGAFDTYIGVESVYPDEVGIRPTLRFVFDAFLDEDELLDFSVVTLRSGGIVVQGRVRWQMSTRTLEFRPLSNLVPGLRYSPEFDAARVVSVTGAPLGEVTARTFLVVDEPEEPPDEPPLVRWPQIDALFEAKCRSCHADPQWQLNPLTRDSMIGVRSAQANETLVVPFDPGDSYLLHKVVEAFPVRRFTVQPPPWSQAAPLTPAEVLSIERWVMTGARD